jgi:hypothetical protein
MKFHEHFMKLRLMKFHELSWHFMKFHEIFHEISLNCSWHSVKFYEFINIWWVFDGFFFSWKNYWWNFMELFHKKVHENFNFFMKFYEKFHHFMEWFPQGMYWTSHSLYVLDITQFVCTGHHTVCMYWISHSLYVLDITQFVFWIWISCLRSNEPCAVKAGPLPPNVNTAQNAAMKWIKLNVSGQTVTLQ